MATPGLYIDTNTLQVGIGTTRPKETFHVQGNLLSTGNITSQGTVTASNLSILGDFVTLNTITSNTEQMVIQNAGTGPALKVTQTGANSIAEFYDDGNALALKIADGGNVGIGAATPQSKLDVNGNITIRTPRIAHFVGDIANARWGMSLGNYRLNFYNESVINSLSDTANISIEGNTYYPKIAFTNSGGLITSGNVGIGTANPQSTLDVNGNAQIKSNLTVSGVINQGGYALFYPSGSSFANGGTDIAWTATIANGITLDATGIEITFANLGIYMASIKFNSDSATTGNIALYSYYKNNGWVSWQNAEMNTAWNGALEIQANFMFIVNSTYSLTWKIMSYNSTGANWFYALTYATWSRLMIWKVG